MSAIVERQCGYTLVRDGIEEPCDRPATSWRWYQDVEHEDCLERACEHHANLGGIRMAELLAEVKGLRAEVALLRDGYNVRPMTETESNLMTQVLELRRERADLRAEVERLRPRRIESVTELDALPDRSVIRDSDGYIFEAEDDNNLSELYGRWSLTGREVPYGSDEVTLPAVVLWEPEAQ